MFVAESSEVSVNQEFSGTEAVEVNWIEIEEVIQQNKSNDIYLAPPQWYMLRQIQKFENPSEFIKSIRKLKRSGDVGSSSQYMFIQPKLVYAVDGEIWHSILPKNSFFTRFDTSVHNLQESKGPFHRITMKFKNGKF